MKPTRLILIPALGSEPAPFLVIEDGVVRDRGLLELHPDTPPEPMRTVAIVPGSEVTIRWPRRRPTGLPPLSAPFRPPVSLVWSPSPGYLFSRPGSAIWRLWGSNRTCWCPTR
ncbi:MAG: hypothetical protein FD125_1067 [bacterium]|nr:MAG: hypothetical protein FD125_1067 [bacterium]